MDDTMLCSTCKKHVPAANFSLHNAYCARHNTVCLRCGTVVRHAQLKEHIKEKHIKREDHGSENGAWLRCEAGENHHGEDFQTSTRAASLCQDAEKTTGRGSIDRHCDLSDQCEVTGSKAARVVSCSGKLSGFSGSSFGKRKVGARKLSDVNKFPEECNDLRGECVPFGNAVTKHDSFQREMPKKTVPVCKHLFSNNSLKFDSLPPNERLSSYVAPTWPSSSEESGTVHRNSNSMPLGCKLNDRPLSHIGLPLNCATSSDTSSNQQTTVGNTQRLYSERILSTPSPPPAVSSVHVSPATSPKCAVSSNRVSPATSAVSAVPDVHVPSSSVASPSFLQRSVSSIYTTPLWGHDGSSPSPVREGYSASPALEPVHVKSSPPSSAAQPILVESSPSPTSPASPIDRAASPPWSHGSQQGFVTFSPAKSPTSSTSSVQILSSPSPEPIDFDEVVSPAVSDSISRQPSSGKPVTDDDAGSRSTKYDLEVAMAMQVEEERKASLTHSHSSSIIRPCPFCQKMLSPSEMKNHQPFCEIDFTSCDKNSSGMVILPLSSDSEDDEPVNAKDKRLSWLFKPLSLPSDMSSSSSNLAKPLLSSTSTTRDGNSVASSSTDTLSGSRRSSDDDEKCCLADFLPGSLKSQTEQALQQYSLATTGLSEDVKKKTSASIMSVWKKEREKQQSSSLSQEVTADRAELLIQQAGLDVVHRSPLQTYKSYTPTQLKANIEEESAEDSGEEYGPALTYTEYKPSRLSIGKKHPDSVVETSSLSSVWAPKISYDLQKSLPCEVIDNGLLSVLQVEAVTYASQRHESIMDDGTRAGFFIGDGAGVGKGRTVAGIIFDNFLQGRKRAIWLSVSNDLKVDAERDLSDICAKDIHVHSLLKLKYTGTVPSKLSQITRGRKVKEAKDEANSLETDTSTKEEDTEKRGGNRREGKVEKDAVNGMADGVMFGTYRALIGESIVEGQRIRRIQRLVEWCAGTGKADDFDGVIVFDECHKAKNLITEGGSPRPTKTGACVLELQSLLPKARVVYCSATGASEPRHMFYMARLGIWGEGTQFRDFDHFLSAVNRHGVGGMEVVAMDMKLRGMYLARQLSFAGSSFRIVDAPLSDEYRKMYDDSVKLWVLARDKFHEMEHLANWGPPNIWAQFWGAHQRFFKYLCIGAKVPHVVRLAKEALANNKCVVIGLQSTGEARTLDQLEESEGLLDDFVSTARGVFSSLIETYFPVKPKEPHKNESLSLLTSKSSLRRGTKRAVTQVCIEDETSSDCDSEDDCLSTVFACKRLKHNTMATSSSSSSEDTGQTVKHEADIVTRSRRAARGKETKLPVFATQKRSSKLTSKLQAMRQLLLDHLETIGSRLPLNTLDELINQLGGTGAVAEMTGRRGRMVGKPNGTAVYELRAENGLAMDQINLAEKDRFMRGNKLVAIISEAASSGISMQADRRVKNQRRRVHITIELPWSADRAIQQFGRTHRSNQTSAPEYVFIISDLAGERRFASAVAKRLESLGAITHGDRRATESHDLSRYNFDTKYGRDALKDVLSSLVGRSTPAVPFPTAEFLSDVCRELTGVGMISVDEWTGQVELVGQKTARKPGKKNISKFLNRILGVSVALQNQLFNYFTDVLASVIANAKRNGKYDEGILDLAGNPENVEIVKVETYEGTTLMGSIFTELFQVQIERGMTWEAARQHYDNRSRAYEGFYVSKMYPSGRYRVMLVISPNDDERRCQVIRPNMGRIYPLHGIIAIRARSIQIRNLARAERLWRAEHEFMKTSCFHDFCYGSCQRRIMGEDCCIGCRHSTYHILSGSLLSLWNMVEEIVAERYSRALNKIPVMRIRCKDGRTIIGSRIPPVCIPKLREELEFIGKGIDNQEDVLL